MYKVKNFFYALCLILQFSSFANFFPNIEQLMKTTGLSRSEVEDCLNWLESQEKHWVIDINDSWNKYYSILPKLINENNFKVGAEIGVAFGNHSVEILSKTSVNKLYCVDPYFPGFPACNSPHVKKYFDIYYLKVLSKLSVFNNRCIFMRKTSVEAARAHKDNSLDFVFIDAMHTYEAVLEDLHAWYSKVRPGGIISGDDYTEIWPGVIKAVNEFFGKLNIKVQQDHNQKRFWWIRK